MLARTIVLVSLAFVAASARFDAECRADDEPWAAKVGDNVVPVSEVQRMFDEVFHERQPPAELLPAAKAQVLEEIVERRLVVAYGNRTGDGPSDAEIAKATAALRPSPAGGSGKKPQQPKVELPPAGSAEDADFRRQLVWRLTWQRFLSRYRTPQRRQAYFAAHRPELDGTELTVSHILLRPDPAAKSPTATDDLMKKAAEIRTEIEAGKISFQQAAAKYSQGPSREHGGLLGKIGRHGPMDEAFSRVAFRLKAGEISQPVISPFGVHLIRCDAVHPGNKQLTDMATQIDLALAKELLEKLSSAERNHTEVKYSPAWPHFKPGTHEVE